ncbi:MAG: hypothetical protein K9L66_01815 [Spirochaetaceae bacterium]|nr:hypothetical protein [Spirochaetaceae bacterium]MCF7948053.1 hypothetical protein [Spirochaetia bacterium]MCF7950389.1 hypothetical protein [Spirochaetaceae bacterium]
MRVPRSLLLFTLLTALVFSPLHVWGQSDEYEAYKPDEFPEWAHSLRRFETIFFGSIPFTFLFSSLGFDMYAYSSSGFQQAYLPLFLGTSPEKEEFNRDTRWQKIGVSISLSLVIALVDFIIDTQTNAEN